MRRVVITGAGTINALGQTVDETLAAMREGRCGISELDIRDVERLSVRIGGQIKGYDEHAHFNRQQIADTLKSRCDCPWVREIAPRVTNVMHRRGGPWQKFIENAWHDIAAPQCFRAFGKLR